ncbi:sensor histidine kinase [Actinocorallia herbida]|nr:nitrate- and nitrite sensing domain-containing protein [Actinocorallia herbida]
MLLVLPLISLAALWGFAAQQSLDQALEEIRFTSVVDDVARPLGILGVALQQERAAATRTLAIGPGEEPASMQQAAAATDEQLEVFRKTTLPAARDILDPAALEALRTFETRLGGLQELRDSIASSAITPIAVFDRYSALFDGTSRALRDLASHNDAGVLQITVTLVSLYEARDHLLREDLLITLLPARGGRMPAEAHLRFTTAVADRAQATEAALAGPSTTVQRMLEEVVNSPGHAAYEALEGEVSENRSVTADVITHWRAQVPELAEQWWRAQLAAIAELAEQTESAGRSTVVQLAIVGGVGLLAVLVSFFMSIRFARHLTSELQALRDNARHLAEKRLPSVIAALRRGDKADATEHPTFGTSQITEVAQVADAFTIVQRTAIDAAIAEARIRGGLNHVFTNLAWRSQSLLHRQLRMLDAMERRTTDATELDDLFKLDHLTTRMRRHAESLVILSGATAMRGWDAPVPSNDIMRAALGEVEDYARVEITGTTSASLEGNAVADVTHLLAELIENATVFSPPSTTVEVRADLVGNGLAIEVVDRGVGMDADDLKAFNRRLAEAPEFDLAESNRLGIFVVARIAARQGIKVTLTPSVYGGITAVVLIPGTLVVQAGNEVPPREAPVRAPIEPPTDQPAPARSQKAASSGTLPRRTRRTPPPPRPVIPPAPQASASDPGRAEASRSMLTALQAGWMAGRQANGSNGTDDPRTASPQEDR